MAAASGTTLGAARADSGPSDGAWAHVMRGAHGGSGQRAVRCASEEALWQGTGSVRSGRAQCIHSATSLAEAAAAHGRPQTVHATLPELVAGGPRAPPPALPLVERRRGLGGFLRALLPPARTRVISE
jgi:hypothetical protein